MKLTLFGTPQTILDQHNLTASLAGRPLARRAYLAVTGQPQERHQVADLLWLDVTETAAQRNLRNALYLLRQAVSDYLLTDRQRMALDRTRPFWVGVAIFANPLARNAQHSAALCRTPGAALPYD